MSNGSEQTAQAPVSAPASLPRRRGKAHHFCKTAAAFRIQQTTHRRRPVHPFGSTCQTVPSVEIAWVSGILLTVYLFAFEVVGVDVAAAIGDGSARTHDPVRAPVMGLEHRPGRQQAPVRRLCIQTP